MKKIILAIIFLSLSSLSVSSAYGCGSDGQCYKESLVNGYIQYEYNNKVYNVSVASTRQEMKALGEQFNKGQLSFDNKYYKTILINALLKHNGLKQLYY